MFGYCFFKQQTAYEVRISDWSSDVCSADLEVPGPLVHVQRTHRVDSVHPVLLPADPGPAARATVPARTAGAWSAGLADPEHIGRASCRQRVCPYVQISVVAVSLTNNSHN